MIDRTISLKTIKDKDPLPIVNELLDELHEAKGFAKLYCRFGYHQIWVAIRDEYKPAFKTHHDLSEFKVMPLGLTNSLASFQGPINSILLPY